MSFNKVARRQDHPLLSSFKRTLKELMLILLIVAAVVPIFDIQQTGSRTNDDCHRVP
ncbi:cation-transporting P-type ATPase [Parachryseolinea silvisoli]|uniref:cation-transporting P-type ATPase n=1 Tax=Parachryseolinea silvisoli TaxID=2873601 RepID=UPI0037CBB08E|nr:hypothetical protein [Parachryseolinea silvisoli]